MQLVPSRSSSERGAVIIQVAVCLLVLLAFSAFVVDYGIMWASRGQIQTAADAGALAGAIALGYDGITDPTLAKADAKNKARAVALQNGVWGQAPDVKLTDVTFPPCPPGAPGPPDTCVKVDAFRNQTRNNPLGMLFGNLVGVGDQGVRSTATAQVIAADTTECLRPWGVVDRWNEFAPGGGEPDTPDDDFLPNSTYDMYSDGKGGAPPQEDDLYVAPSENDPGTGFRLPEDEGRRFAVKADNANTISSGWFMEIRIPRLDGYQGGSVYEENIKTCGGLPSTVAEPGFECPNDVSDNPAYWATKGCFAVLTGNKVGPTRQGVDYLVAQDSGASYVDGTGIVGSDFDPPTKSPRVVPIAVFDIADYLSKYPTGSNGVIRMSNIYGFFIEGMGDVNEATGQMTCCSNGGKAVIGRIMTIPGQGAGKLTNSATFLRSVILVR